MDGLPVTIRTLDPPLTSSPAHRRRNQGARPQAEGEGKVSLVKRSNAARGEPISDIGAAGGVVFPEITEMQARAFRSCRARPEKGVKGFQK